MMTRALIADRGAELSRDEVYRWTLWRQWALERGTVAWLMLNPSTADAMTDDPTVRRCTLFSQAWGYGRLMIVNLYPFRSSSPVQCRRWSRWEDRGPDWSVRDALQENLEVIERAGRGAALRVAAFGAGDWFVDWAEQCAEAFAQPNACGDLRLFCLGINKDGGPLHPMARGKNRVPDDRRPILWRP